MTMTWLDAGSLASRIMRLRSAQAALAVPDRTERGGPAGGPAQDGVARGKARPEGSAPAERRSSLSRYADYYFI